MYRSKAGINIFFKKIIIIIKKKKKKFILSGSERMHERPIAVLVDALNNLGFNIKFLEKKGYPPLEIYGTRNMKEVVKLNANVSSQFISALALIGPSLKNGITIELDGEVTSKPYIEMTISMLNEIGVFSSFEKNIIKVKSTKNIKDCTYNVESDWSSISYFFSIIALSKNLELTFSSFNKGRHRSMRGIHASAKIIRRSGPVAETGTLTLSKSIIGPASILGTTLIKVIPVSDSPKATPVSIGDAPR